MSTASGKVRIRVKGVKINTLLPPAALPADLVPPEPQPAGIKTIAEHGPDNVNVLLQGNLRPEAAAGGPYELDAAGLNVTPKTPKSEAP
jgi:hypothetical protein